MKDWGFITPLAFLTLVLAAAGVWAVFCRLSIMVPGRTRLLVGIQHAVLAIGLFTAAMWTPNWGFIRGFGAHGWVIDLLMQREIGQLVLAASVLAFLLMSAHRWHLSAPEGTNREIV